MKNQLIAPSSNFNSVRDGRNSPDFYFDLDLSVTFDQTIVIAGNSFYADANPEDGNCTVYFQDTDGLRGPTPFYVSPGFIARIPFTQVRFVNSNAQPGKKIRLVYGTDTDFQPGSVSQLTITNRDNPLATVRSSKAFITATSQQSPAGGNSVYWGVRNNDSRRIYIKRISVMVPAAPATPGRFYFAGPYTLGAPIVLGASSVGKNFFESNTNVRPATYAAANLGLANITPLFTVNSVGNYSMEYEYPFLIDPNNYAFAFCESTMVSTNISAAFEWEYE